MQQEVEKMARQIILDLTAYIDYSDICEMVADAEPYPNCGELDDAGFDDFCLAVDAKIKEAKVIVKFGR